MTPRGMEALAKSHVAFIMESGAGALAGFPDLEYEQKGARVTADRAEVFGASEVILQVRTAGANPEAARADLRLLRPRQVVIGFGEPLNAAPEYAELAERGVTSFAMELIPRITRAQSMEALSSM